MSRMTSEDSLELLEALALLYYPGLYVLINEPLDEVLGITGLRADLIAATSPSFDRASICALGIVSMGAQVRGVPADWRKILEASRDAPWHVDFFVPNRDVAGIRALVGSPNANVRVRPLPQPSPRPILMRSATRSTFVR